MMASSMKQESRGFSHVRFKIIDNYLKIIRKYVRYNREGKLVPYKETGGK